jgi:hypothetical protein
MGHKSSQIMACADGMIIISRPIPSAKEIYSDVTSSASKTIGLPMNANKTKMIIQTHRFREKD